RRKLVAALPGRGDAIGFLFCAAISPDGRTVAGNGPLAAVDLYDVATGRKRLTMPSLVNGVVYALAFAPDGRVLAAGTGQLQKSGEVKLWDAATGKELHTLKGYRNHVLSLAFTPDGRGPAPAAKDGTVKLWDVATGRERLTFQAGARVPAVAFSPDGRRLAVAAGETITLREAATGKVLVTIHGYSHEPASLVFSPDGRRLVSGGGEGELGRGGGVKLWDTATGLEVLSLGGPSDVISCVAVSPDGGRLAAAAGSGMAFLGTQAVGEVTVWDGRPPAGPAPRKE